MLTGTGSFENSLSLECFNDNTFTNDFAGQKYRLTGAVLFVEAAWSTTSLRDKLNFYIQSCDVVSIDCDDEELASVRIIDESCYAQVVKAAPLGQAVQNQIVKHKSQFNYRSFSFRRDIWDTQMSRRKENER